MPNVTSYVTGTEVQQRQQENAIAEYCKEKGLIRSSIIKQSPFRGIYDLLLKLKKGDTVVVSSIANLSGDYTTAAYIILSCLKNGISIISVKEDMLGLTPNNYVEGMAEGRLFAHAVSVCYRVLHHSVPV